VTNLPTGAALELQVRLQLKLMTSEKNIIADLMDFQVKLNEHVNTK